MIPRRAFLRSLALASLAAAIRPTGLTAATNSVSRATAGADGTLTLSAFDALRGETFAMAGIDGTTKTITLDQVTTHRREAHVENFVLRFRGEIEADFKQGTRRMTHPELGEFDLFVVARSADGRNGSYEAVFNRLV